MSVLLGPTGIAKKASDSLIDRNQFNCSAESTLVIIPAILGFFLAPWAFHLLQYPTGSKAQKRKDSLIGLLIRLQEEVFFVDNDVDNADET